MLDAGSGSDIRLVLHRPGIPQNCGAPMRLGACLAVALDPIEPFGFLLDDRGLRRTGLDYRELANTRRHASWERCRAQEAGWIVLLTTAASLPYLEGMLEATTGTATACCWDASQRACRR